MDKKTSKAKGKGLVCNKCGYGWTYRGNAGYYTSCPQCRFLVKVNKVKGR